MQLDSTISSQSQGCHNSMGQRQSFFVRSMLRNTQITELNTPCDITVHSFHPIAYSFQMK